MCRDATLSHPYLFDNRIVVIYPSHSKCISTRRAETCSVVSSFVNKEASLSIWYNMIRCILFTKSKQGTHCTKYQSARNCIFGHLQSIQIVIYTFHSKQLHFSLETCRNATGNYSQQYYLKECGQKRRSDFQPHMPFGKGVVIISPKAVRKYSRENGVFLELHASTLCEKLVNRQT